MQGAGTNMGRAKLASAAKGARMESILTRATPLNSAAPKDWREELSALSRLAWPLVGANLLQMAIGAVDVFFAARLTTKDFAAATLGVFAFNLTMYALIGLASASAPIIAAELGRRSHAVREVRRSARMAMWAALGGALPVFILLGFGDLLFRVAGQDAEVSRRTGEFLSIIRYALFPGLAGVVMRIVCSALGRANWAFAVTLMGLGIGVLCNWLFIFGHGGFPAMGLAGSALATLVGTAATTLAYVLILLFDPKLRRYRLFGRFWRPEWLRLAEIVRLGAPIAASWTFEGALFGGAAVLMGLIGVADVAAHAVALNIAAIAFQIPLGVAQAATIRVGLGFGAGDRAWMARAGWVAIIAGTAIMALTAGVIWVAPTAIISAYLDTADPANATVVALAVRFLMVAAAFQLFDGCQVVAAGVLRGLQDTRWPMVIAGIGYWAVGFGTAILLGFRAHWGGVGVWVGLAVGLAAVAAPMTLRWAWRERLGLVPVTAH